MLSASADMLVFAASTVPYGNRLEAVDRSGQRLRVWEEPNGQNWPRLSGRGNDLVTFYLGRKDDARALEHARLAANMDAKRVARDPHNAGAKVDYAVVLSQMGVCSKRLGLREDALTYYLQSLAIRRELWESDRANVNARDHLMYMLTEIANLELSVGKWEGARTHVLEAVRHATALHGKVSSSLPQETLIQGFSHLGRAAKGLKADPCPFSRKSLALAPASPDAIENFQYRVAVKLALESARDGLHSCPQ